jgi:hypothetical protein
MTTADAAREVTTKKAAGRGNGADAARLAELDAIWEARCELEKQSFLNESIGLAGLAALLSGAMTAYQTMGVDATKSKAKLLDRALAARQRLATGSEPLVVPQQPSPSLPDVDDDN